nr:kinesin-like protein KIN-12D [Ipomoea batatas]
MLRDFKFLRRNAGKNPQLEETENVPVNPSDSLGSQISNVDSSRPPLNTIQERSIVDHEVGARVAKVARTPSTIQEKSVVDQEVGVRAARIDRTPTKSKSGRYSDSTMPLKTPERQKNRFGWAQRSDMSSMELKDEVKLDGTANGGPSRTMANMGTPRSTRTVARANSSYSECNSTQNTPTKSVSKPPNPGFCLASGSRPPANGGARMANYMALSKGVPISCNTSTVVNTVDVPHFELKEDPSFWMEHNVQVLIRVRPLNGMERSNNGYNRCLKQESAQCITWIGQPETRFTFDHVACESVDQETLFRMAGLPMVENCLSGYNSCVFAYGQTGSGKTYTMLGEIEELEVRPSPNRGMTPRIFEFLFTRIRAEEESRREERLKYSCKCSFLEIYNEQITDLLDPSSTNLMLREDITKGVYVENLSEFEVQTVGDILKLLSQGSSNRRVAATNMNRESSRSHSVFTCVIESSWEKDSASNFRFARLNLVDLAGSERQKTSGAEGERLKEAANINKSLSTLGHVIMVLVDIAHGRPRHIPYRDSRLTFLLQDSLGGNSKTMMIANVSPSICCAAETLNTLKFAQRAKLIQNNAVVNEDSSADVAALQHQIRLLKEELSTLKRQNISRSLSFGAACTGDQREEESKNSLTLSTKQFKSLETTLAGALRREQMAETSIKQLEAENEQLNRLVRQREEDTRCTKMMLKFREDKIQRMESLLNGLTPADTYLLEDNRALAEELQLIRAKVDKNPEVTRFALENIRLLEQLRRFQDFYEEGERNMLLSEVSELRDQLRLSLDGNLKLHNHFDINIPSQESIHVSKENNSLRRELKETLSQLEECRSNLNSCLDKNAELRREITDLRASLGGMGSSILDNDSGVEVIKESISEAPPLNYQSAIIAHEEKPNISCDKMLNWSEKIMDLQLELDLLKVLLQEEKSSHNEAEERALSLNRDLESSKDQILFITKQYKDVQEELKEAKSIIEALESQQILAINEVEDLRNSNNRYAELVQKQELEISSLKEKTCSKELRDLSSPKVLESEDTPLQAKLKKMHNSLEKAKTLNKWYQSDRALQTSNADEMDEIRRQVEVETAEVIVCLQEELSLLQQEVQASHLKETESLDRLSELQCEIKELEEKNYLITEDNRTLRGAFEEKERELQSLLEELEQVSDEMETILGGGQVALKDASDQIDLISASFPQKRASRISDHFGRMAKYIFEKDLLIEDLNRSLEDALNKRNDVESMLRSLRGAALVMTEAHQQQCSEKDREIILLTSQLNSKVQAVSEYENKVKHVEDQLRETSTCATAAFVVVNWLSELQASCIDAFKQKEVKLGEYLEANMQEHNIFCNQSSIIQKEAEQQIESLKLELQALEETCSGLRLELSEQQRHASAMQQKLEELEVNDIMETMETLEELKTGVSVVSSCMNEHVERHGRPKRDTTNEDPSHFSVKEECEIRTGANAKQPVDSCKDVETEQKDPSFEIQKNIAGQKSPHGRDATIALLKKEIVSALDSLKKVQAEMARLHNEKEEVCKAEKQSRESIESLFIPIVALGTSIENFEQEVKLKMEEVDEKLQQVEYAVQEYRNSWFEQNELMEAELGDAKAIAIQKTTEASCILAKFVEVQDTMKDADIMINELMIANEALKLENKELKKKEVKLTNERDILENENHCLQSANDLKDLYAGKLEKEFESDLSMVKQQVLELEDIISQANSCWMEEFISMASDVLNIKSDLHDTTELMRSWIEDIWSEIIVKDCAVSTFHLCHSGILLEAVNGFNAENGLLHHGLCESNSVITELREHNFKARQELEMCRTLKGKLLADIKSSFDRISRKEGETSELTLKLATFEKKIIDLQFQEELMLKRSDHLGSELAELIKEMHLSNQNVLATLVDRERLLQEKEEAMKSAEEDFIMKLVVKDFEVFILSMKLQEMAVLISNFEKTNRSYCEVAENLKREMILYSLDVSINESILVDKEIEVSFLKGKVEGAEEQEQKLVLELNEKNSTIAHFNDINKALEQDVHSLRDIACSNEKLKTELCEVVGTKITLSSQVQKLNSELEKVIEELKIKESDLEVSSSHISDLDQQNQMLQNSILLQEEASFRLQKELEMKDAEVVKISCLGKDNDALQGELRGLKAEYGVLVQDLEVMRAELESSLNSKRVISAESDRLRDAICSLENHICNNDILINRVFSVFLKNFDEQEGELHKICEEVGNASRFLGEFELLENLAKEIVSQNSSLGNELLRKDDILKGLLFDLSLLQESASNTKDKKDEIENLVASLNVLENELEQKSRELDEIVSKDIKLEAQLLENKSIISDLESDVSRKSEDVELLSRKNDELLASINDVLEEKTLMEEELTEQRKASENLENELSEMGSALLEMNNSIESLRRNLDLVTCEKDDLSGELLALKKKLEMAQVLAEENEAVALEAKELAEIRKLYADEKEEEVKLLERSIEELDCTVNVLENKVGIIKEEAERQRLQREELEMELHNVKQQMLGVKSSDADAKRNLDEKEKNLLEASQRIQILEKEIALRDAEIAQCKGHISELNLHAEAQASEYKEKFKTLEAMAEKVKLDVHATQGSISSSNKLEKNALKPRGSGSPFKCIGIGLVQQLKSERDEDLTAEKHRIEELEALAASRQKEIFMLNSRLAAAESMTHDVIRDLLGLKLDMNSYATLLDNHQVQMLAEKAQLHNADAVAKDQEVNKLKQQLNEFIEERKGWLEEIERKQAEMMAAKVALEKLHERDQLLTTENEMIKMENINHKKRVMELEAEVKKLSGQQNLHQRIHHHAKIKEENNTLKNENDDLTFKLRKTEAILARVREELAHFRASNGRSPHFNFEEEQRLEIKLKEREEEKLQLAQKLLGLCSSVLKAAGIKRSTSEVNLPMAEEALEQLKNRVDSLERELHDVKLKNKMSNERQRLSELMPQTSARSSMADENGQNPNRSPFLTALDR